MDARSKRPSWLCRLFLALGLIHLGLVICGTSYIDVTELPIIGEALGYYGELSGAGDNYGFFSPGIEGQLAVWFELLNADGSRTRVTLPTDANREAKIRVGDIVDQFSQEHPDPVGFQRAMTASFAAKIAQLHPETKQISVHIDELKSISMADYRAGLRAHWTPIYQADFLPPRSSDKSAPVPQRLSQ